MKNITVGIFGAGISGLTVADELSKKGFDVCIFEKQSIIGGLARSSKGNVNIPTEVSWRGVGPFYHNMINKLSEIPYKDKSVFDYGLIAPISFKVENNHKSVDISKSISFSDKIILTDLLLNFKMLNLQNRLFWSNINASDYLKKRLTYDAWYVLSNAFGPFIGIDRSRCSMYQFLNFYMMVLINDKKYVYHNEVLNWDLKSCIIGSIGPKGCGMWSLFSGSSSDVYFDPWKIKLHKQNVKIYTNHELLSIQHHNKTITSVNIKNNNNNIINNKNFDYYIMSLSPFGMTTVLQKSNMPVLLETHLNLIQDGPHFQIPFTIFFNKKVNMPRFAFIFGESPYNITLYFQSDTWKENNSNIKSCFWSGTACTNYTKGILFKKCISELNKEEFFLEIATQIENSKPFQQLVEKYNFGKNLTFFLTDTKWSTWSTFDFSKSKGLQTDEPKWVNSTTNELFRPYTKTDINNFILSGAHIMNTMSLYSMEAAVETGLMAANSVLENFPQLPLCKIHYH